MRSTSTVAKAAVLLLASSSWLGADSLSTPALEPTSHSERHRELKTCAEIEREKKCETPGCAWKDEVCVDCTSINKQKDCADPGCMWTGSCEAVPTTERPTRSPVTYCAGFDKEKDCPIDMADYMGTGLGCQWNEDGKVCENSPTPMPTVSPTTSPTTSEPTRRPTNEPTTQEPTLNTDQPTSRPTKRPTRHPTRRPTDQPTNEPTGRPTRSPTKEPTVSPTESPTSVPSDSPSVSFLPTMAPIPYIRPARVETRFAAWTDLTDDQKTSAYGLGYDNTTWDQHGTNEVELLDWIGLTDAQRTDAEALGFDLESWDCWMNHYQAYRWIDLANYEVRSKQWWMDLGWSIKSWNSITDPPPSSLLSWFELSEEERYAAAKLCYFKQSWDGGYILYGGFPMARPEFRYRHWFNLSPSARTRASAMGYTTLTWNVHGLDPVESKRWDSLTDKEARNAAVLGFTGTIWDCFINHYRSYSWEELQLYGLDLSYGVLGWNEASWSGQTRAPPSQKRRWSELTSLEREIATSELCYFRDNWDGLDMTPNFGIFPYPKPKQRYVPWSALDADFKRSMSESLLYTEDTWNNLGTAEVEGYSWRQLTARQRYDAMHSLGMHERTWDCFQNHYRALSWDEIELDAQMALEKLGYNSLNYDAGVVPSVFRNSWDRLSSSERDALPDLCYFEDNWDKINLQDVYSDDVPDIGSTDYGSITDLDSSQPGSGVKPSEGNDNFEAMTDDSVAASDVPSQTVDETEVDVSKTVTAPSNGGTVGVSDTPLDLVRPIVQPKDMSSSTLSSRQIKMASFLAAMVFGMLLS